MQIPGYYYDKKKKKYFKIQQNGFNVQEGSVTVSTVKKRKERQRVKKQEKQLEIRKVADNILTRHYQSQLCKQAKSCSLSCGYEFILFVILLSDSKIMF